MKKTFLILCLLLGVKSTMMAQTGNNCANAITVTVGTTQLDSITAAPASHPDARKAKWYKYTPATDGLMAIQSCLQGSDTRLWIYVGRCDSLVQFGASDDDCEYIASSPDLRAASLTKAVKAGKTYFLEWDNRWDSTRFAFTLQLSSYTPTVGQACATAIMLPTVGGTIRVDSLTGYAATRGDANKSIWYKYTPTRAGRLSIASCGGGTNTRFFLYKGTCAALTVIGDGDDECPMSPTDVAGLAASVADVAVLANQTYFLEWDDAGSDNGFDFTLSFDVVNGLNESDWVHTLYMYPNPASTSVTTEYDFIGNQAVTLKVFNMTGQLVSQQVLSENHRGTTEMDVSNWKSGLYVLEWSNGTQRVRRKLAVQ
ncbi:MAG: hypothetical protein RIS64_2142 [Bacteroidota bacterium]|jgi:Secretion system C-terminal sorting domain